MIKTANTQNMIKKFDNFITPENTKKVKYPLVIHFSSFTDNYLHEKKSDKKRKEKFIIMGKDKQIVTNNNDNTMKNNAI